MKYVILEPFALPSTAAPPKKRIVSIQVCRGLAAMVVVLAHLSNVEQKYFATHLLNVFQFGVAGVDLFFVISGVVISSVTVGQFHSTHNAVRFLYHRFARIYPILWIYTSVVLVAFLYNPHWVNAKNDGHVEIARSYFLIPGHYGFLLMQGWTLSFEVYFYLIFFLLMLISTEKLAPWLLALWGLLAICGALLNTSHTNPLIDLTASPLVFEFLAGCVIFSIYRLQTAPWSGDSAHRRLFNLVCRHRRLDDPSTWRSPVGGSGPIRAPCTFRQLLNALSLRVHGA